jgi:large conductance mechanosensitive channel
MLKGFRDFILRGNVVDLAVAFVMGAAFNSVVNSLVKDLITPIIAIFGGASEFSATYFVIRGSKFMIGDFIDSLVSFLITAAVIYFLMVLPMNKISARIKKGQKVDVAEKVCPECLSQIPIKARKCKFCGSVQKDNNVS